MLATQVMIGELQNDLNALLENKKTYTEQEEEIYRLSRQLDELIVAYYREM